MAQNIFMAQTNFLIPLCGLTKEWREQLERKEPKFIESYFCVNKNGIECRYIRLENHDFYFKSFPNDSHDFVFHKVTLEPYLILYRLSPEYKKKQYFLAVSVKTDKCFKETYIKANNNGFILQPARNVCTDRDLIYLQKAFYKKPSDSTSEEGFFYPLQDPIKNHITWVKTLCCKLEGKKERDISFEYSAIKVISSYIDFKNLPIINPVDTMAQRMANNYYDSHYQDFDSCWRSEDARFAMCLISGNDNINNVSTSRVEGYSNNKHERTYANKSGIVFLQTHHPFDLNAEDNDKYHAGILPIPWQKDLEKAHIIPELCTALFFKHKLERISKRLGEKRIKSIKDALARLASYLHTEYTHIADIDKKFMFICRQMGIVEDFENLSNEAELLFNSYSLRLSTCFNKLMVLLAAVALVPTVLQIIQTFLYNQKSPIMKCFCSGADVEIPPSAFDTWCYHDPIIFTLLLLALILLLLGLYNYVFIPYVKKKHLQFHEEMEDEM